MKKRLAFSLLELIIVIAIIGILASIGLARYSNVVEKARRAEAYTVLSEIVTAEKRYYLDNDAYTLTITALDSFSTAPASANFTFSVPSANATTGYARAQRTAVTGGRLSYYTCLNSGRRDSCSVDPCVPACP